MKDRRKQKTTNGIYKMATLHIEIELSFAMAIMVLSSLTVFSTFFFIFSLLGHDISPLVKNQKKIKINIK